MTAATLFETGKSAVFDETGQYRYALRREFGDGPIVTFIMLNPSKADAERNDNTVTRCLGFARHWGFGTLQVVNLFAYRATDSSELHGVADPIGPDNDRHILEACVPAGQIICAWGAHPLAPVRARAVVAQLQAHQYPLYCLEVTQDGWPRHPLYVRSKTLPLLWACPQEGR